MTSSHIVLRFATLLFLLAGILLLRKPVFGETITAPATTRFAVVQVPACAATTSASLCTSDQSPSTPPAQLIESATTPPHPMTIGIASKIRIIVGVGTAPGPNRSPVNSSPREIRRVTHLRNPRTVTLTRSHTLSS